MEPNLSLANRELNGGFVWTLTTDGMILNYNLRSHRKIALNKWLNALMTFQNSFEKQSVNRHFSDRTRNMEKDMKICYRQTCEARRVVLVDLLMMDQKHICDVISKVTEEIRNDKHHSEMPMDMWLFGGLITFQFPYLTKYLIRNKNQAWVAIRSLLFESLIHNKYTLASNALVRGIMCSMQYWQKKDFEYFIETKSHLLFIKHHPVIAHVLKPQFIHYMIFCAFKLDKRTFEKMKRLFSKDYVYNFYDMICRGSIMAGDCFMGARNCDWPYCVKKNVALKKCKRCKLAVYCGKKHQKKDWKLIHSSQCIVH